MTTTLIEPPVGPLSTPETMIQMAQFFLHTRNLLAEVGGVEPTRMAHCFNSMAKQMLDAADEVAKFAAVAAPADPNQQMLNALPQGTAVLGAMQVDLTFVETCLAAVMLWAAATPQMRGRVISGAPVPNRISVDIGYIENGVIAGLSSAANTLRNLELQVMQDLGGTKQ